MKGRDPNLTRRERGWKIRDLKLRQILMSRVRM